MTFILGESKLGYDYFGTYEIQLVTQVDRPDAVQGENSTPGTLVCPFVPADHQTDLTITVEREH